MFQGLVSRIKQLRKSMKKPQFFTNVQVLPTEAYRGVGICHISLGIWWTKNEPHDPQGSYEKIPLSTLYDHLVLIWLQWKTSRCCVRSIRRNLQSLFQKSESFPQTNIDICNNANCQKSSPEKWPCFHLDGDGHCFENCLILLFNI